jgi:hypothetical protein
MKTKYWFICMALLSIFITSAFAQDYVKPFPSKEYDEYGSWRKSPLNPLKNSKPAWNVNKWPPQKPKRTVQEERVWTSPTNQKIVSSENSENKETKETQNPRKFVKPHVETIDDKFLK